MEPVKDGDGPVKLLFVSRNNLPKIVQHIAPDMVLVPRARFTEAAEMMLEIVEGAARQK